MCWQALERIGVLYALEMSVSEQDAAIRSATRKTLGSTPQHAAAEQEMLAKLLQPP